MQLPAQPEVLLLARQAEMLHMPADYRQGKQSTSLRHPIDPAMPGWRQSRTLLQWSARLAVPFRGTTNGRTAERLLWEGGAADEAVGPSRGRGIGQHARTLERGERSRSHPKLVWEAQRLRTLEDTAAWKQLDCMLIADVPAVESRYYPMPECL